MNENRLPGYLDHMRQAAEDACSFVDGLGTAACAACVTELPTAISISTSI